MNHTLTAMKRMSGTIFAICERNCRPHARPALTPRTLTPASRMTTPEMMAAYLAAVHKCLGRGSAPRPDLEAARVPLGKMMCARTAQTPRREIFCWLRSHVVDPRWRNQTAQFRDSNRISPLSSLMLQPRHATQP